MHKRSIAYFIPIHTENCNSVMNVLEPLCMLSKTLTVSQSLVQDITILKNTVFLKNGDSVVSEFYFQLNIYFIYKAPTKKERLKGIPLPKIKCSLGTSPVPHKYSEPFT